MSVVDLMGCSSGTGEYEAAREKSQYTHYKKLGYTTDVGAELLQG